VRKVSSLVGQIISMSIVLGHVTQIMTRFLSIDILAAHSWDFYIPLSEDSIEQIRFWQNNLGAINSRSITESYKCSKIVFSDASSTGYAGYEVHAANDVSHGMWSAEEAAKSSTWRELTAVYRVLLSIARVLAHKRVKWFTDNQGVVSIVFKGSMKHELQNIAMAIYRLCMGYSIVLEMDWIPRSENEKADYFSKITDFDDWGISFEMLSILQARYGVFEIDWFASENNAKVSKFYSRFLNPSSFGVDAFTANWDEYFGLFVPPIKIVHMVLRKMDADQAKWVLVVPYGDRLHFGLYFVPQASLFQQ